MVVTYLSFDTLRVSLDWMMILIAQTIGNVVMNDPNFTSARFLLLCQTSAVNQ